MFQQIFPQARNPRSPIGIAINGKSRYSLALSLRDSARKRLKHDDANLIGGLTAWVQIYKSESNQNRKV